VTDLSKDNKDLTKQLKSLNENVEVLIKLTAMSLGKDYLFKGKEEVGEKIDVFEGLDLSDKIIALIVGSTPESVQSLRSQRKAKLKKGQPVPSQQGEMTNIEKSV